MPAVHGSAIPRGLDGADAVDAGRGRFGRMFPRLPVRRLSAAAIEELLAIMFVASASPNDDVPAGYTYMGQFIDHDLTFDPSSLQQRDDDPPAIVNFRTPRLDLDSVYGSGPADQPYLYEWGDDADAHGVELLVARHRPWLDRPYFDLPRNVRGRALIGDPRNDENLILAQLHLLFLQFHNRVVEHVRGRPATLSARQVFREARRIVRWHYQWMIVNDFLPKIVNEDTLQAVHAAADPGGDATRCLRFDRDPYIPVEFSGAAFRFGHSMVRPGYDINPRTSLLIMPAPRLAPAPGIEGPSLRGFRVLPKELVIDWRRFFALSSEAPQPSMKIDMRIARRLFALPADIGTDGEPSLPLLNLRRAAKLRLPAGPDVARAMGIDPLDAAQLRIARSDAAIQDELLRGAPLWYYILCEARALQDGTQLGPVGGRIVAEVLVGLIEADPSSYVNAASPWKPGELGSGDTFQLADMIRFTHPEYAKA